MELWAMYQKTKSGNMMKRSQKEKEIAEELNKYGTSIGLDVDFNGKIIHNKIDNLKSKAKDLYRKFQSATTTGSAVTGEVDLEGAYASWANFRTWHRLFRHVPGFGPLRSISSVSIPDVDPPIISGGGSLISQASRSESAIGIPDEHPPRPTSHDASAVSRSPSSLPSSSSSSLLSSSPSPSSSLASRPRMRVSGDDSDNDIVGDTMQHAVSSPAGATASSTPACTPTYRPGEKTRARILEDDMDEDDDVPIGPLKKKKKKRSSAPPPDVTSIEDVGMRMVDRLSDTQLKLQENQHRFVAGIVRENREHTQALVQSQMVFLKKLFDDDK